MLILKYLLLSCLLISSLIGAEFDQLAMKQVPVAFKGRIRPLEAYARLWLFELYHAEQIKADDAKVFHLQSISPIELIWKLHFLGHQPWDDSPIFWISKSLTKTLDFSIDKSTFSYEDLSKAIYENENTNIEFLQILLPYQFWKNYLSPINKSKNPRQELSQLAPGLWLLLKENKILSIASPKSPPWHFLKPYMIVHGDVSKLDLRKAKTFADEALGLLLSMNQFSQIGASLPDDLQIERLVDVLSANGIAPQEIALQLEAQFPLSTRLMKADNLLHILPSKQGKGIWLPIKALKTRVYDPDRKRLTLVKNFTPYPDSHFESIRSTYLELEEATLKGSSEQIHFLSNKLAEQLNKSYQIIEGNRTIEAVGKVLSYPSQQQLGAEVFYYQLPLIPIALFLYALAMALLLTAFFIKKDFLSWGVIFLGIAFIFHTLILVLRCYILGRPPVSNMFETIIYVPWIAVLASFGLFFAKRRHPLVLIASALVAFILFLLLQITGIHNGLEVVQAVLDSQYWLIIHVLMVVGSYGAFALAGLLGHLYLTGVLVKGKETGVTRFLGKSILQAIYLGIALLVPGTILGGIWAAESWGRFWDWDPKESWAFISICTYLIWVHAFRFHYVRYFGLAIGSIIGFLAISFTWYGVNYILGTGLHSYGFGSGGEFYYYIFILFEIIFLTYASIGRRFSFFKFLNNSLDK